MNPTLDLTDKSSIESTEPRTLPPVQDKSFKTNAALNKDSYVAQTKNIRERLSDLVASRIPHVFVMDFDSWPDSNRQAPVILTTNIVATVAMLGLVQEHGNVYKVSGYETFRCYVYPKGANIFPETFETRMLASSELMSGIRVPSEWFRFHALLYWNLARDGMHMNDLNTRKVYAEYAVKSVGMFVAPDPVMCTELGSFPF